MRSVLFVILALAYVTAMPGNADASARIYLLKGLANVFSTGLDSLADQLTQRGYTVSVNGHGGHLDNAADAVKVQKNGKGPIIIIGHSLGANAAISMAERMKEAGAPIALIVTFSPTRDLVAPSNVRSVVNYHQSLSLWKGTVIKGPGFNGTITNINLDASDSITHFNMEKNVRLHGQIVARVQAIAGGGHRAATHSQAAPPRTGIDHSPN